MSSSTDVEELIERARMNGSSRSTASAEPAPLPPTVLPSPKKHRTRSPSTSSSEEPVVHVAKVVSKASIKKSKRIAVVQGSKYVKDDVIARCRTAIMAKVKATVVTERGSMAGDVVVVVDPLELNDQWIDLDSRIIEDERFDQWIAHLEAML